MTATLSDTGSLTATRVMHGPFFQASLTLTTPVTNHTDAYPVSRRFLNASHAAHRIRPTQGFSQSVHGQATRRRIYSYVVLSSQPQPFSRADRMTQAYPVAAASPSGAPTRLMAT